MINLLKTPGLPQVPTLEFTPRAVDALKEIRKGRNIPDEYLVRLGVNMRPKQRYEYMLGYSKHEDGDTSIRKNGIPCIIETGLLPYFDNVSVDYADSVHGRGFTFLQREKNFAAHMSFAGAGPEEMDALRALQQVIDPELGVNIVDVGLVYSVVFKNGTLAVTYTLSTKNCPMSGVIRGDIESALQSAVPGIPHELVLTHDPAWSPAMITPRGKVLLQK